MSKAMIRATPVNQIVPSGTRSGVKALIHEYVSQYMQLVIRHATRNAEKSRRRTVQEADVESAIHLLRAALPSRTKEEKVSKYTVGKAVREAFRPMNVSSGVLNVLEEEVQAFVARLKERLESTVFKDKTQARRVAVEDVLGILKTSDGFTEYGTPSFVYRD